MSQGRAPATPVVVAGGSGRLRSLDVLRGIAVLLVLGAHLPPPPVFRFSGLTAAFTWWIRCGPIGVDLFFVLSGFLVAGLLLREQTECGSISWARFFVRRGLKIYPGFYLLLLATVFVAAVFPSWDLPRPATPPRLLAEALFVQNYFANVWTHTWSLAVEEHFYLLLPALLLLIRRPRAEAPFAGLPWVCAVLALAVQAARAATVFLSPAHRNDIHNATHLRLDSLLFGVLLAYAHHFHGDRLAAFARNYRARLALIAVALLAPGFLSADSHARWYDAFAPTLLYLGFGVVLLLALHANEGIKRGIVRVLAAAVARVGFYSYSIYLWHMPVLLWGIGLLRSAVGGPVNYAVEAAVFTVASLAAGIGMALVVELPALRLRDRRFPSQSGGAA